MKEKEEQEKKWRTKSGFDNVMKKQNWNAHPKQLDKTQIEALLVPYHEQALETKLAMKGFQYNPTHDGKPHFQSKIKIDRQGTFSKKDYFKTVFISGDDMVKEELEMKKKEQEDWQKKVVVANTHFQVNTLEKSQVSQLDKYKNIREDDATKIGLRIGKTSISKMVERQIMVTR